MKNQKLKASDKEGVLTRAQLKKVMGGNEQPPEGSAFFCQCANGSSFQVTGGTQQQALEIARSICIPNVVHCSPSFSTIDPS